MQSAARVLSPLRAHGGRVLSAAAVVPRLLSARPLAISRPFAAASASASAASPIATAIATPLRRVSSAPRARAPLSLTSSLLTPIRLPSSSSSSRRFSSAAVGSILKNISTVAEGTAGTKDWRLFFVNGQKKISPWHDIPLYPTALAEKDVLVTYINEIPQGTRPKLEIATKEEINPIKQDIKKSALRLFTYGDIPFNYGCLPQTWEDPTHAHKDTGCVGDNDPLDVVEVSGVPIPIGSVVTVRVLGLLALIDEGETDWKILAISDQSPLFAQLRDQDDLETYHPKVVTTVRDWFRSYKTTDGKPENKFAFDGKIRSQAYAMRVVAECNTAWEALRSGKIPGKDLK